MSINRFPVTAVVTELGGRTSCRHRCLRCSKRWPRSSRIRTAATLWYARVTCWIDLVQQPAATAASEVVGGIFAVPDPDRDHVEPYRRRFDQLARHVEPTVMTGGSRCFGAVPAEAASGARGCAGAGAVGAARGRSRSPRGRGSRLCTHSLPGRIRCAATGLRV